MRALRAALRRSRRVLRAGIDAGRRLGRRLPLGERPVIVGGAAGEFEHLDPTGRYGLDLVAPAVDEGAVLVGDHRAHPFDGRELLRISNDPMVTPRFAA